MANSKFSTSHKIDNDTANLISYLSTRKTKYFSFCISVGLISSILIKLYVLGYSSTGSFFVNDMNVLSSANVDLKVIDNLTPNDNFNRIFQQAISTSVQNHLIKKFNLTAHYGVDSTKEFYLQRTGNILIQKISVKKNTLNTILVTVNDEHRYLAADMANEIMAYLDEINRDYYAKTIEQKLKISESFLIEVKKDNVAKSKNVDQLISEMQQLTQSANRSTTSSIQMLQLEQRLGELINELTWSTHDLTNSQKLYNLSLQALNQKNNKTITVVQSAMPAPTSNIYMAVLYGSLISITLFCLLIFRIHIILNYSSHFKLLFNNKEEES